MFSHLFKKDIRSKKKYLYFRGMNESSVCIFKLIIISLFGLVTISYPKISYAISQDSLINSQNKKGWNVTPFPEIAYKMKTETVCLRHSSRTILQKVASLVTHRRRWRLPRTLS